MNILWIYNLPLIPEAGGTERITSLVSRGLTLYGHQCLGILVFNERIGSITYESESITDLYAFLCERQVDIVINQIAYDKWLLDVFLKRGGEQWHREKGQIISCLHFDPKNPSLLYLLKGKNNKNIKDILSILKATVLYKYYEYKQSKREGETYNYIYNHSDWFVALSPTHFPYLHKIMQRSEYSKLIAINNPLTFKDVSTSEILEKKKKIVLVCARMSEYHKRISVILKAWMAICKRKEFNGWTLKMVGVGPDLQRYKDFVSTNRIPNVRFEGQQSSEPYYNEASILLLTSSAEGWGLTITEGLQRGVVPVVMNSCSVFGEIIQNGYNGYLTPDKDMKVFENKVLQLMSEPSILRQMQLHALESAKKFSLESTMNKWEKMIQSSENS
jgi:glycosyltransferase involved in cell wall biosynthesis